MHRTIIKLIVDGEDRIESDDNDKNRISTSRDVGALRHIIIELVHLFGLQMC